MTHNMKKMAAKALLTSAAALAGLGLASGTAHAFDPQPDPPSNPRVTSVNPQKSFADGSVRVGDGSVRIGDGSVRMGDGSV
jgi:hypothetical protein